MYPASVLVFSGFLAALTVFDIVIHVATNQVEPLRIAGNVTVLVAALALLVTLWARRAWVPIAAGLGNLILNVIFITREEIGTLGIVLIAATTVLCLVLAVQLARRPKSLI